MRFFLLFMSLLCAVFLLVDAATVLKFGVDFGMTSRKAQSLHAALDLILGPRLHAVAAASVSAALGLGFLWIGIQSFRWWPRRYSD